MKATTLLAMFLVSPTLLAHHGAVTQGALYHSDVLTELEGEVVEVLWRYPHARARLKVVGDDGEETIWELELGPPPNGFESRGIFAEDFEGRLKVAGHVSRRRPNILGVLNVLMPNGMEYARGNRELMYSTVRAADGGRPPPEVPDAAKVAEAEAAADGIFRVWGRGSSPESDIPTELFTERAHELIAAYDPLVDNADIQCRQGMPDTMYDPTFLEITNLGDTIVMHVQEFNIHRTIHMTENDPEPSDVGYSTGRWDGDTLIMNTTHVDWPYWSEIPVPQSDQTSYLERFSISDGGRTLHHSITIADPVVFAEPFTIERTREWTPGVELLVRECVDWSD